MDWTLADIRTKVRNLTGLKRTSQLSSDDLDDAINNYYCNELPREISHQQFDDWLEFSTTADQDEYILDTDSAITDGDRIIAVKPWCTADGDEVTVHFDEDRFYNLYPESDTFTSQQPVDVLIDGRTLIFAPPPDDAYAIKMPIVASRPAMFAEEGSYPLEKSWGPLIAYGAAIELLMEKNRFEDAAALKGRKEELRILAAGDRVMQQSGREATRHF